MVFPKNMFPIHFYKIAPLTYFWGQTDYVARFEEKFSWTKTALARPPKLFFRKTRFLSVFMKPPHLFSRPDRLCGAFRGKIITDENFAHFCQKRPQNCFSEKYVSYPFLRNCPPTYFWAKRTSQVFVQDNFASKRAT